MGGNERGGKGGEEEGLSLGRGITDISEEHESEPSLNELRGMLSADDAGMAS